MGGNHKCSRWFRLRVGVRATLPVVRMPRKTRFLVRWRPWPSACVHRGGLPHPHASLARPATTLRTMRCFKVGSVWLCMCSLCGLSLLAVLWTKCAPTDAAPAHSLTHPTLARKRGKPCVLCGEPAHPVAHFSSPAFLSGCPCTLLEVLIRWSTNPATMASNKQGSFVGMPSRFGWVAGGKSQRAGRRRTGGHEERHGQRGLVTQVRPRMRWCVP